MEIIEIKENKKQFLPLLLLADEQESMIDRYIDRGTMYVLVDNGVKCECVVTDEGKGILEIKNISEKDSFVLCSDGVHNTLTVDHLRLLLSENDNLTQIQEYLKIHADDNYSLILVNN